MRSVAIVFLLLVTAWTAAAQKVGGNDGTLVLKNGTLVLNGVKLKTSESIIAVLGEEVLPGKMETGGVDEVGRHSPDGRRLNWNRRGGRR